MEKWKRPIEMVKRTLKTLETFSPFYRFHRKQLIQVPISEAALYTHTTNTIPIEILVIVNPWKGLGPPTVLEWVPMYTAHFRQSLKGSLTEV